MWTTLIAETLVEMVRALQSLTQLERLTFVLERPEVPFQDSSAELTDAMVTSLRHMISLQYIYIGNIPWVNPEDIRHVIRCE